MFRYLAGGRSLPNCFVNASSVGPEIGVFELGLSPGRGRTISAIVEDVFEV